MQNSRLMSASVLLAPLLDGPVRRLHTAYQSRYAAQIADDSGRVVFSVIHPDAVRLPFACSITAPVSVSPSISVGDGSLTWGNDLYTVARWWQPARPRFGVLRRAERPAAANELLAEWPDMLGRGPGLTPYGDDVLCGALVALHAASAPGFASLADEIRNADLEARTTATSASLLRTACDGWCIDELADYLRALATDTGVARAEATLRGVGASSGHGLIEGVARVLPHGSLAAA